MNPQMVKPSPNGILRGGPTSGEWFLRRFGVYAKQPDKDVQVAIVVWRSLDELAANAYLISAAKELLEACHIALTLGPCDLCYDDSCSECECACHEENDLIRRTIAQAIAKAEGREYEDF